MATFEHLFKLSVILLRRDFINKFLNFLKSFMKLFARKSITESIRKIFSLYRERTLPKTFPNLTRIMQRKCTLENREVQDTGNASNKMVLIKFLFLWTEIVLKEMRGTAEMGRQENFFLQS